MEMKLIPSSSSLYALGYDDTTGELHVTFCGKADGEGNKTPGRRYIYSDVPKPLHESLVARSDANDAVLAAGGRVDKPDGVSAMFNERIKGTKGSPLFAYREVKPETKPEEV